MSNYNHGSLMGDQFRLSIIRRTQGKQTDGNNADSESKHPDGGSPEKTPQAEASVIKSKKTNYHEKEHGI